MTRVVSDASSARNIWDFGVKNQVEGNWQPLAEEVVRLKFWLKQIRKAQKAITAVSNQLKAMDHHIHNLQGERRFLEKQLAERKSELEEAQYQALEMGKAFEEIMTLLRTIKGIGPYSALHLIVLFCGNYSIKNARKALSLAGMSLRRADSGTSVHKPPRISKMGSVGLRTSLYMAALNASKFNKPCKELYDRMLAKGKSKRSALVAVSCKLLRQAYGVWNSNIPFDPDYANKYLERNPG